MILFASGHQFEQWWHSIDASTDRSPERELMTRQCFKRKLVPDEMARICLFLAADDSSAMTNQTYVADGGWV